jgi:hypothetical protein
MHNNPSARFVAVVVTALFCLIIGVTALAGVPAQTPKIELVVLCDVSASLKPEVIRSEAKVAFRFINDPTLFPSGDFSIYVADQDVERGLMLEDKKVSSPYPDEALMEVQRLNSRQVDLENMLGNYFNTHRDRNKTCLVKAIRSSPHLFHDATRPENRRLLIVSDMLEDCVGTGDPKTEQQLRKHIQLSMKQYALPGLAGTGVIATVVPSTSEALDIDVLRNVWASALEPTHAHFALDTIEGLLHNMAAMN